MVMMVEKIGVVVFVVVERNLFQNGRQDQLYESHQEVSFQHTHSSDVLIGGHMKEVGFLIESETWTVLQNLNRFPNLEIQVGVSRLSRFRNAATFRPDRGGIFVTRTICVVTVVRWLDLFELTSRAGSCFGKGNDSHVQLELFLDMLFEHVNINLVTDQDQSVLRFGMPMSLANPDVQKVAEGEGVVFCLQGGLESQRRLGDLVGYLGCEVVEVAGKLHDLGGVVLFVRCSHPK